MPWGVLTCYNNKMSFKILDKLINGEKPVTLLSLFDVAMWLGYIEILFAVNKRKQRRYKQ